ncbi:uncharacterized protein LOC109425786 [Aedes albopictus]|uniref:THAP-type domain-containing protein n=1 Tax=Aedes albopictus TaxID=7160 RepID=A0ABM1YPK5_AEDAL|nr:uncharacterized protein LOC109425786 [Aedes albopictus]
MTKVCVVCGNRASETDRQIVDPLQKVTYHKIPISVSRNKKWLEFCSLTKKDNINNKFVCSEHFEKHYLERDLKSELLDGVKRMILKREAVPTIKTPKKLKRRKSEDSEQDQHKKRKEEIDRLLNSDYPQPITNPFRQKNTKSSRNKLTSGTSDDVVEVEMSSLSRRQETRRLKELETENKALKLKVEELEQVVVKKNEKINLAKTEMVNITIALQELKDIENRNLNIRVKELLKGHYTENQIRRVFNNKEVISWTNEEMQQAFTIRMFGSDVHDYVCKKLRHPSPSLNEMLRWVQKVHQQTGFLIPTLGILQVLGSRMDSQERECILLIGRTKVHPKYYYDPVRDQIFGKDAYLYCICVQSIFSDWHQIIYIDIDLIYSTDILMALINELHEIGFNVAGITAMCDQETADLWTELDVSTEEHFIRHPKTKNPIYMFCCPISTLTVILKIFVEDGLLVQEDVSVTKDIIQKLYESNHPEITQLLSTTTLDSLLNDSNVSEMDSVGDVISDNFVQALKLLSEEGEESIGVAATLFELIRDWYDLLTTERKTSDEAEDLSITHQEYGNNIDEQNIVLDGMYDTIETLKCSSEQATCLQQAILISMNSLKKLFNDLRQIHDCKSIPTRNLTLFNLNRTFDAFQENNPSSIQPTSKILFELSKTILTRDQSSLSSKIVEETRLPAVEMVYEASDATVDPSVANISEKLACSNLINYVATTLREKYEYLGDQTFVIERKDNSYVVMPEMPTGIVEPSKLWMEQARKLETYVSDITFYRNENVVENLVNSISRRHPKMGVDIIRLYVQRRIMIKLNNMNRDLEIV